jgi:Holliday junction resolvasome RuvABC endonuclease subunit
MRILGLDLSIAGTGVCRHDDNHRFLAYTLPLASKYGDDRLNMIRDHVAAIAPGHDFAVIEDLPKNAMAAGVTGMVQGCVRPVLNDLGIPYVKVVPATLKLYATGHGRADKKDMTKSMIELAKRKPDTHNAADAFWLWHLGMDHVGQPYCTIPGERRYRLEVVDWTPAQDVIDDAIKRQASAQSF